MISQADFFKTLVNKNSTDESILSTASSPDCKPTKLLEKLTEAERFGLALEVSMKFGLDPSSIWKTWAIRCLKNRNFTAARDKFRHCFTRSRPHSGRTSGATSALLMDILNQLAMMNADKLSLREEVELIKGRKLSERLQEEKVAKQDGLSSLERKKIIFEECMYYLNEYGSATDHIKFYVKHGLWDKVVKTLIDKRSHINKKKLFCNDVLGYAMAEGQLKELLSAFMRLDPEFKQTNDYFRTIYEFLSSNRWFNVLYYVQSSIGDHLAAANTQLNYLFLAKPYLNYRELNNRLAHLNIACDEYKTYLQKERLSSTLVANTPSNVISEIFDTCFFGQVPVDALRKVVETAELQIVITKNFFINEVSGCVNDINTHMTDCGLTWSTINEVGDLSCVLKQHIDRLKSDRDCQETIGPKITNSESSAPVTLFDKDRNRITFLVALVLIYFDLTCSTYFSKNGLDLADQLINDYELDKLSVFKVAARIIIEDESCEIVETVTLLLNHLKADYIAMSNRAVVATAHEAKLRAQAASARNNNKQTTGEIVSKSEVIPVRSRQQQQQADHSVTGILSTSQQSSSPENTLTTKDRASRHSTTGGRPKDLSKQSLRAAAAAATTTTSAFSPSTTPYAMLARRSSQLFQQSHYMEANTSLTPTTTTLSTSAAAKTASYSSSSRSKQPSMNWTQTSSVQQSTQTNNNTSDCNDNVIGLQQQQQTNKSNRTTGSNASNSGSSMLAGATMSRAARQLIVAGSTATTTTTTTTPANATTKVGKSRKSAAMAAAAMQNSAIELNERARMLCDLVIFDAIGNCREPDYKMELAKLLSDEAKFELYVVLGKLSNAQHLAFQMNRADYVARVVETAKRLNQDHVRTVCQLWLAKHETSAQVGGAFSGSTATAANAAAAVDRT